MENNLKNENAKSQIDNEKILEKKRKRYGMLLNVN